MVFVPEVVESTLGFEAYENDDFFRVGADR
jgi:hypothetical protein